MIKQSNRITEHEDFEDPNFCSHGIYKGWNGNCGLCEDEEWDNGGIDKCLNCGKYCWGKDLNSDQCCKIPCRNPNEE